MEICRRTSTVRNGSKTQVEAAKGRLNSLEEQITVEGERFLSGSHTPDSVLTDDVANNESRFNSGWLPADNCQEHMYPLLVIITVI